MVRALHILQVGWISSENREARSRRFTLTGLLEGELGTVAAGRHDLCAAVQHGRGISSRDYHLFRQTHVAAPRAALVRRRAPCHVPSDLVLGVLVLEVPHIFRESSLLSASGSPERARVGIEPLLEWTLG